MSDTAGKDALAFWSSWLVAFSLFVIAFGAVFLVAPALGQTIFDAVYYFPETPRKLDPDAAAYVRFANGVLGAMMFGWMALIAIVANEPFRRGERWAWRAIVASLLAWFVPDTTFSIANGVVGNALLNSGILLGYAIPLIATARSFGPPMERS